HWGYVPGVSHFSLYENDELIAEASRPRGEFPLNLEQATYRMEVTTNYDEEFSPYSKTTNTIWTFHSERSPTVLRQNLLLLTLDYDLNLKLDNTASLSETIDGEIPLSFQVGHQPGAEEYPIEGATVWVSYNDGD